MAIRPHKFSQKGRRRYRRENEQKTRKCLALAVPLPLAGLPLLEGGQRTDVKNVTPGNGKAAQVNKSTTT